MKLTGERTVLATPAQIWAALLDPETLKACIPGCEELTKTGDTTYRAAMVSKVGPIKARFAGNVTVDESNLPESCVLNGEGSGGVAGFVKGSAVLRVVPASDDAGAGSSQLTYDADVEIGGKIASLGDRLFRGVVERNINQLLDVLQQRIASAMTN
ncbi:carbon monoxide dehydrogenase subunit G [soil metagenome]